MDLKIVSIGWEDKDYKLVKIKFKSNHKKGTYPLYFYVGAPEDLEGIEIEDYCKNICPLRSNLNKCRENIKEWICSEIWDNEMVLDFFRENGVERSFPVKKYDKGYFYSVGDY
jgi:hypothetical protein